MATVSIAICASHSPFLYATPEEWTAARIARERPGAFAAGLAADSDAETAAKHARCMAAFEVLRRKLEAARPDVLVIFGDDQLEQFDFGNFPAFCIFIGEEFSGYKISPFVGLPTGKPREKRPRDAEHWVTAPGHPPLAKRLMTGLMTRGFDMAFSAGKAEGVGHAFMRPLLSLTPGFDIPTVPIYINCYYGPQPTGARCHQLGRAIREVIDGWPSDLKVGVIGSGGLWHTPLGDEALIDGGFDAAILGAARSGDAKAMAAAFDACTPSFDPDDPRQLDQASGGTGMVLGYGSGTGEVRNWIAAAAVVDGTPGTVVDYVEINASPIGAAFAYWDQPSKGAVRV
ncbi:MAG: hypothetical protein ABIO37_18985 [Caulobacteraceae bacterium]